MLVTVAQMRELEAQAMAWGLSEEELMERAGRALAEALARRWYSDSERPGPRLLLALLGKGHNAGDALVAAREWKNRARLRGELEPEVRLVSPFQPDEWRELTASRLVVLGNGQVFATCREALAGRPDLLASEVVALDGLLGIGGNSVLRGPLRELALEINALRRKSNLRVVAMDLPSGLDANAGTGDEATVVADLTLSVGECKKGLVREEAARWVGVLETVEVEGLSRRFNGRREENDACLGLGFPIDLRQIQADLPPQRAQDWHKGRAGRVAVVAGSPGMLGAAELASLGASRGGAGLVSLQVPGSVHQTLSTRCPAEIMVRSFRSWEDLPERPEIARADALLVGPGIGPVDPEALLDLILATEGIPVVLDADGLNVLARLPVGRWPLDRALLLTPHPGEMTRLLAASDFPRLPGLPASPGVEHRAELARAFADCFPNWTLLLKGARTLVAAGKSLAYNLTGGPGMASGGQGDLLAGVVAALLAQGSTPPAAARAAVWLCGRAAEEALVRDGQCAESLSAPATAARLGTAYRAAREGLSFLDGAPGDMRISEEEYGAGKE